MHYRCLLLLLCVVASTHASAKPWRQLQTDSWTGIVTHVIDGDTVWLRLADQQASDKSVRKVRIEGIDAPEICQNYGAQSKIALTKLLLKQSVAVITKRYDDYGREVAKISLRDQDVGAWMVTQGHAWSYHYRFSAGPYAEQEMAAQTAQRGLFADSAAVPPAVFRRDHGTCHLPRQPLSRTPNN